jgi:hypothetical protein
VVYFSSNKITFAMLIITLGCQAKWLKDDAPTKKYFDKRQWQDFRNKQLIFNKISTSLMKSFKVLL